MRGKARRKRKSRFIGDIYNPGTGRLQIRNNQHRIIGYIERDGTVTNTSRQPVASARSKISHRMS